MNNDYKLMLNILDVIGENMTIEEFVKSLTYDQKRELILIYMKTGQSCGREGDLNDQMEAY